MQKKTSQWSCFDQKRSLRTRSRILRGLDLRGLRARWLSVFQRPAPSSSDPGTCCLRSSPIGSRLTASATSITQTKTSAGPETDAKENWTGNVRPAWPSFDQKTEASLLLATVLVREWDRRSQRVMVIG